MHIPVVVHKDPDSDYGVSVPDLPGCFSAGGSLDEALENVTEAISCHIEGLLRDGEPLPTVHPLESHLSNPDWANGIWAVVRLDLSKISDKTKRINVTLPEHILSRVDRFAAKNGESRSGFLTQAALEYIDRHVEKG